VSEKVTFAADSFFAVGSSALNAESQAKLADLADKTKGVNLEVIIAVGHTDSTGSAALNQKRSRRVGQEVPDQQGHRVESDLHGRQGLLAAGR
jgi:OOP family OmpA-OmpF porin